MERKTTKELLAASFFELAAKKRIDKITITQITSNCSLSQPTFYNHFKDKYDLIVWIYTTRISEIMAQIGKNGYMWRDILLEGAKSFSANREYVVNALKHTSGQDSFKQYVSKVNIDMMIAEVRKKLKTDNIPEDIIDMMRIYVYGTVQHMLEWLLGDMKPSPEQVALIWEKSLPEPLKEYLYD